MKVAVYTIALNEEAFVKRWMESAKLADYLLIADTGSSDKTKEIAIGLGINVLDVRVMPWRFDIARNAALAAIPVDVDYCISLDMDEVLCEGWREELEKAYIQKWTRPRYKYTWSWKDSLETIPGLQYGGDKIHFRKGYRWVHPVHEVLRKYDGIESQGWIGLEIHHHPDSKKSRSQYLPLLEMAVREDPTDDRNSFYYARELHFSNEIEKSNEEFKRHLALRSSIWKPERAASMRYLAKGEPDKALYWLERACTEDPSRREAFVELAFYYYVRNDWELCLQKCLCALSIEDMPLDYLCEAFAWGTLPYDIASIAAYKLGKHEDALTFCQKALNLDPHNIRLQGNLKVFKEELP